jgi:hypothetical protein
MEMAVIIITKMKEVYTSKVLNNLISDNSSSMVSAFHNLIDESSDALTESIPVKIARYFFMTTVLPYCKDVLEHHQVCTSDVILSIYVYIYVSIYVS